MDKKYRLLLSSNEKKRYEQAFEQYANLYLQAHKFFKHENDGKNIYSHIANKDNVSIKKLRRIIIRKIAFYTKIKIKNKMRYMFITEENGKWFASFLYSERKKTPIDEHIMNLTRIDVGVY